MEIGDISVIYIHIYSTWDLTFAACAQNYVIWAEFSTNYLLSMEQPVVTVERELQGLVSSSLAMALLAIVSKLSLSAIRSEYH